MVNFPTLGLIPSNRVPDSPNGDNPTFNSNSRPQFGRILAYAYSAQGGDSIDETLSREGLATAWIRDGQYRDLLVNLERNAKMQGVGCLG